LFATLYVLKPASQASVSFAQYLQPETAQFRGGIQGQLQPCRVPRLQFFELLYIAYSRFIACFGARCKLLAQHFGSRLELLVELSHAFLESLPLRYALPVSAS